MKFDAIGSQGSGGNQKEDFLRLKDGDSFRVLFRGEPHVFYCLWNGQFYEEVPRGTKVMGSDGKEKKAGFRFKVNVIVEENGKYIPKIFEQGFGLYEQMAETNKEYALEKYWMKLSRKGSGAQDTTYAIVPAKGGEVSPEEEKKLSHFKLHVLKQDKEVKAKAVEDEEPIGDTPFGEM